MKYPKIIKAGTNIVDTVNDQSSRNHDVVLLKLTEYSKLLDNVFMIDYIKHFILTLIKEEELMQSKLSENLNIYHKLGKMELYDKTFSQWNKGILVLWNYKDILCRMGEDMD